MQCMMYRCTGQRLFLLQHYTSLQQPKREGINSWQSQLSALQPHAVYTSVYIYACMCGTPFSVQLFSPPTIQLRHDTAQNIAAVQDQDPGPEQAQGQSQRKQGPA